MQYLAAAVLSTFFMFDVPQNQSFTLQMYEIECNGIVHQVEHYMEPDHDITCMIIEELEKENKDWDTKILDDNKKRKP